MDEEKPRKTLGQLIYEKQIDDGMTHAEIELFNKAINHLAIVKSYFELGFLLECKNKKVRPTIFRYKKYIKRQEEEINDYRKNFKKYREVDPS